MGSNLLVFQMLHYAQQKETYNTLLKRAEEIFPSTQIYNNFKSELKTAFEISFIIFIPFIVLDLVVANVLLALGMFMLSPTIVSLPFKLLIFIAVDGWGLIVNGLVGSFN